MPLERQLCSICDRPPTECKAFAKVLDCQPTTHEEREDCEEHEIDWCQLARRYRRAWQWLLPKNLDLELVESVMEMTKERL